MALILVFGALIAGFVILLENSDLRKTLFLTTYAIGSVVMAKIQPTEISLGENRWKFGYATGAIMLVVLVSCFFYARRKYIFAGSCLAAIAGYNVLVNYRSAFLEIMIATVLVVPIIPERIGRLRFLPRKKGIAHVLILVGLVLGAGWLAGKIVIYATNAGYLGEEV